MVSRPLPEGDRALIQIVDAALAEATRRGGEWIACRPGCTQCCVGVFAINQLDALRLKDGLESLEKREPFRAERIRKRANAAIRRMKADFPGDGNSGILEDGPEAEERFAEFGNDEVCPVLDPETGLCELYDTRPLTCRAFGPPVESEGGLGVCELCFQGASDEQIAACEMKVDPEDVEQELLREVEKAGRTGRTIVAYCVK